MFKEGTEVRITLAGIRAYCQCDIPAIHGEHSGDLKYIDAMLKCVEKNTVFTVVERTGLLGGLYAKDEAGDEWHLYDMLVTNTKVSDSDTSSVTSSQE